MLDLNKVLKTLGEQNSVYNDLRILLKDDIETLSEIIDLCYSLVGVPGFYPIVLTYEVIPTLQAIGEDYYNTPEQYKKYEIKN